MCRSVFRHHHYKHSDRISSCWCTPLLHICLRIRVSLFTEVHCNADIKCRPLGWAPFVADFFIYHPKTSNRWLIFCMTLLGFMTSKIFVEYIGIGWCPFSTNMLLLSHKICLGLGSGLAKNPSWAKGFTGSNVGGLIVAAYGPLGAYGKFCAVVL